MAHATRAVTACSESVACLVGPRCKHRCPFLPICSNGRKARLGGTRHRDTVRRAAAGDAVAVEVLARRALTLALRTSAAMLGFGEDAADVAQEVAIDVLRGLRSLRDPALFDAWVYRITARRALRFLRSRRGRSRAESQLESLAEHEQPSVGFGEVRRRVGKAARRPSPLRHRSMELAR
jgi:DNA-directed RNA polymerase specialized sigma24 family protein